MRGLLLLMRPHHGKHAGRPRPGAALKVVADDETGELEGITILGPVGRDPGRLRREPASG
jgi:hypothetical protein